MRPEISSQNWQSHKLVQDDQSRLPPGLCLGPLMWNIFQNDLYFFVKSSLSMYANNHQMFHVGNDQSTVALELRETARNATNWYDSNLLAGNLKMYHTINIGDSENKNDVTGTICVNNEEIKTVDKLEPIGVIIDSNLNFADHISLISKNASQRTGVLMRLRNLIPVRLLPDGQDKR